MKLLVLGEGSWDFHCKAPEISFLNPLTLTVKTKFSNF